MLTCAIRVTFIPFCSALTFCWTQYFFCEHNLFIIIFIVHVRLKKHEYFLFVLWKLFTKGCFLSPTIFCLETHCHCRVFYFLFFIFPICCLFYVKQTSSKKFNIVLNLVCYYVRTKKKKKRSKSFYWKGWNF